MSNGGVLVQQILLKTGGKYMKVILKWLVYIVVVVMVEIFGTYSGREKPTIGGEGFDSVSNVRFAAPPSLVVDSVWGFTSCLRGRWKLPKSTPVKKIRCDSYGRSFKICGRDYKVGKDDIVDVFGLPNSGECIVESRNAIDREKLAELYNIDSSKKIYLQDLVIDLDMIDGKSNEFKAKFVLYTIGCLLCPRSATYVESSWLGYLNEKVLKGEVDWASHVHKMLWSGINEFKKSVGNQYVSGCIIILQVMCADIVLGNRERRRGCRPLKILASSWGVQEMNTLLSGIDDYGIEKKEARDEPKLSDHDVQTDDCNKKNMYGLEEDTIMSWSDDCEDVKGSSLNGDGHEQCPMDEADVPSSPKEKGDDGDELQWLRMEFAKTNAKVESCMSLLNVVMEDVKFIKSQLLDGSKSYVGKRDEGIPRTYGDAGERQNAFGSFDNTPDFKESGDAGERHNAFGGFDKTTDFNESDDAGERHNTFGSFDKTPTKQEWNPNSSTKGGPKSWSWNIGSPKDFGGRQTFWSNMDEGFVGYSVDDEPYSPPDPSRFVFTPPKGIYRNQSSAPPNYGRDVFNEARTSAGSMPRNDDVDPIFGNFVSLSSFEYVLGRTMLMNPHPNISPSTVVVEYERQYANVNWHSLLTLRPNRLICESVIDLVVYQCSVESRKRWGNLRKWFLPAFLFDVVIVFDLQNQLKFFRGNPKTSLLTLRAELIRHMFRPGIYMSTLAECNEIIVPMNESNYHWFLMVIDIKGRFIKILDSLPCEPHNPIRLKEVKELDVCDEIYVIKICGHEQDRSFLAGFLTNLTSNIHRTMMLVALDINDPMHNVAGASTKVIEGGENRDASLRISFSKSKGPSIFPNERISTQVVARKGKNQCSLHFASATSFPPSVYSRLHRSISPEVTLMDINGMTCQVKVVVRESDNQILLDHGWPTFYDAHYLRGCDYLVFRLVNDWIFQVSVFCDCGIEVVDFLSDHCH
ncbi:hypothetical protein COLO4_35220 [Corchorus olitorius]|uniref:Ubiquitin-like protease family profile domain-containing protein n=1 Tax=Corchorus olitorius TaxID=93759 RepID=A0A1R3GHP6_9ROSI|nr:hypothetical protein COLO4_35220 [Corchorus olitorius]